MIRYSIRFSVFLALSLCLCQTVFGIRTVVLKLESVYEAALSYELIQIGLTIATQVGLPVNYNNVKLELGFRIDIIVEDCVIIEVKSVEAIHDVHKKQLLTYLKLSGKKIGILVNFNVSTLKDKESLIRIIN